jgi:hypothetical protein
MLKQRDRALSQKFDIATLWGRSKAKAEFRRNQRADRPLSHHCRSLLVGVGSAERERSAPGKMKISDINRFANFSAAKLEFETEQAFSPSRKFRKKLWGDLTWIPGQPLNHRGRRHCPEAPSWSRAGGIAARDDAARAGAARSQDINPIQALPVLLSFCLPSR